ncbi:MAG: fumarate hydratase [Chitinispirillaceae bacterium]|nr:fumarate hydratase [Chitinispirillaceae bacterium]
MRIVEFSMIVEAVRQLCMKAACDLPADVLEGLQRARDTEQSPQGTAILEQLITNASIASARRMPICQDTGSAVFFVAVGSECGIDRGTFTEAINEGCACGYREGYLRASIVNDPLFERVNTRDNIPALIHYDFVAGDSLSITILPKGGGCENMSALAMLKPADGREGIIDFVVKTVDAAGGNACPPVIVGVGIGGNADKASSCAKKALLRKIGSRHPDPRYADLETELLTRVNGTGNGPQGLGGTVTALAVHIETFPCHIASMPVAVNLNCHAARQATVVL